MGFHERLRLSRMINARGTYTPLGVSRSSPTVAAAVAEALPEFVVVEELADRASEVLVDATGAEAGAVVHCTAAAITVAVAAAMAGTDPGRIAALPDSTGMKDRVVVPEGQAVNYGQSNLQAIRLAGAKVSLVPQEELAFSEDVACMVVVSSRLARQIDLTAAVRAAHDNGVPVIIDGAAQFPRVGELLATGADAVLVSGQKYLASPTAGLVLGKREFVRAVRAQDKGIGRGMKPTKEAIAGVIAAVGQWRLDPWLAEEAGKVAAFVREAATIPGIAAREWPDPAGLPVSRAVLTVEDAAGLVAELEAGDPPVFVMTRGDELVLELVSLGEKEVRVILNRLRAARG